MIPPGIFGGPIKLKVPPKIENMTHATTSDHDGGMILDLAGGCLWHLLTAVVCAVVALVIASRPKYSWVRGLNIFHLSRHFLGHMELKMPSKVDNVKHATTSDQRILDLAGGCLRHLLPAVVGAVVPSVVAPRPIYR